MDKQVCRWCGEAIRKVRSKWQHVEDDNGRCDALCVRYHGEAKDPEPA